MIRLMMMAVFLVLFGCYFQAVIDIEGQLSPENKEINAETIYQVKLDLKNQISPGSVMKLDFSKSQIVPKSPITLCTYVASNNNNIDLLPCSSINSIVTVNFAITINKGTVANIRIGNIVNPGYVSNQLVKLQLDYNDGNTSDKDITITTGSFIQGQLQSTKLEQANEIVNTANAYTFVFTNKHPIPSQGRLLFTFPYDVKYDTNTKVVVTDMTLNLQISTQQKFSQQNKLQIVCINAFQNGLPSSQVSKFKLENVINPYSVKQSDSGILVSTHTVDDYLIDESNSSTDFKSKSTVTQSLDIQNMFAIDKKVNDQTSLFFFMQPQVNFDTTAKLVVVHPTEVSFNTQVLIDKVHTKVQGTDSQIISYEASSRSIILRNFTAISSSSTYIVLGGLVNPSSTKPSSKFMFYIKTYSTTSSLDNQDILEYKGSDLTLTSIPGILSLINSSPSRTQQSLGKAANIQFDIQLGNKIPKNSKVEIHLPQTDYKLSSNSAIACKKVVSQVKSDITCTIKSVGNTDNSYIVFDFVEFCSGLNQECGKGSQMTMIVFESGTNPLYISSTVLSSKVYTKTADDYTIDQLETGITINPALVLNPIEQFDFQLLANSNGIQYRQLATSTYQIYSYNKNNYQIKFVIDPYIRQFNGQISITFPKGAIISKDTATNNVKCYVNGQAVTDCSIVQNDVSDLILGVKEVKILKICDKVTDICKSSSAATIKLDGFYTPLSGQALDTQNFPYKMTMLTDNGDSVAQGSKTTINSYTLSSQSFQALTVQLDNMTVNNKNTKLSLSFGINVPFPAVNHPVYQTQFSIVIPSELVIQQNSQCSVSLTDVSFKCSIDQNNRKVVVKYETSTFNDYTKLMDKTLSVEVNNLQNPLSMKPSSVFNVALFTATNNNILYDDKQKVTMTQYSGINDAVIERNNIQKNGYVELTISFSLSTYIPQNGKIQITLSLDQVKFTSGQTVNSNSIMQSIYLYDKDNKQIIYSVEQFDSSYLSIKFVETSCPCNESTKLKYVFKNRPDSNSNNVYMRNIDQQKLYQQSNKIFSYDADNYGISKIDTNFYMTPSIAIGTLTINSISSTIRKVNDPTQIEFTISIKSQLLFGKQCRIVFQPQQQMYYKYETLKAEINGVNVQTITEILKYDDGVTDNPQYIESVQLLLADSLITSLNSKMDSINVKISNVYNYYLAYDSSQTQSMKVSTTYDDSFYIIDQGTIQSDQMYTNKQASLEKQSISRTGFYVNNHTDFQYLITSQTILKKGFTFKLDIPNVQFQYPPSSMVVGCNTKDDQFKQISSYKITQNTSSSYQVQLDLEDTSCCYNSSRSVYCSRYSQLKLVLKGMKNAFSVPDLSKDVYFQMQVSQSSLMNQNGSINHNVLLPNIEVFNGQIQERVFTGEDYPVQSSLIWLLLLFILLNVLISYCIYKSRKKKDDEARLQQAKLDHHNKTSRNRDEFNRNGDGNGDGDNNNGDGSNNQNGDGDDINNNNGNIYDDELYDELRPIVDCRKDNLQNVNMVEFVDEDGNILEQYQHYFDQNGKPIYSRIREAGYINKDGKYVSPKDPEYSKKEYQKYKQKIQQSDSTSKYGYKHYKLRNKIPRYNYMNLAVSQLGILQAFTRFLLLIDLMYRKYRYMAMLVMISVSGNVAIGMYLVYYSMRTMEEGVLLYSIVSNDQQYRRVYKLSQILCIFIGPKPALLLSSGMCCVPYLGLEQFYPYFLDINRTLKYSLALSIVQFIVDIVILVFLTVFEYSFHLAIQDILFCLIVESIIVSMLVKQSKVKFNYNQ